MGHEWPLCVAYCGFIGQKPGPWFNIMMLSYQHRESHSGDKTILRPSYLHNGISYTGQMASVYWIMNQIYFHASIYVLNNISIYSPKQIQWCMATFLSVYKSQVYDIWTVSNQTSWQKETKHNLIKDMLSYKYRSNTIIYFLCLVK